MQYTEENNYPKAFGATAVIMGALFALCFLLTFSLPPKPEEGTGGILVNYGTTDEGSGSDFMSLEEPSKADKANKTQPDKVNTTDNNTPSADNSDQKVVTQDAEDAPVVNNKKNSNSSAAQAQKPEPQRVPDQRALFKGMKNTGTGQGDGTTGTPGNQGSPDGSNQSDNYGPGGSGNGLNLPHWEFVSSPDVKNIHRVPGIVIIDFVIDQNGNVIQTSINRKSRAPLDQIQQCEKELRNSKLRSNSPASGNQKGTMTWKFNVD
ncbi:energy transducer TonB [Mucilaginibacter sp. HMF5004]|uniref:energy transducer TonB n=1 Tax=Mucilaginibacter rivuli TaxID=2857527 RepID=UPI001C600361|nr:energy transducer TonB [Mucilaginibacter rivuli]MBW4890600.1 energy transducer TonB [Mucilaginibacter rivuli]